MAILATLVMHTYGLESGQLQAWQAFYDAVGVSGCSKCSKRHNPCGGCSSDYIECTSDGQYLTKIWLSSCSLSGKSFFCIIAFFIWFSHCAIFFLIGQYCQNNFCQFLFSYVGWLVPFFIFVIFWRYVILVEIAPLTEMSLTNCTAILNYSDRSDSERDWRSHCTDNTFSLGKST